MPDDFNDRDDLMAAAFGFIKGQLRNERAAAVRMTSDGVEVQPAGGKAALCAPFQLSSIDPAEVLFRVGHTQIEEVFGHEENLGTLMAGSMSWIDGCIRGQITEQISRRGSRIVRTTVTMLNQAGERSTASYTTLHWPFIVRTEEINYQPYN